MIDKFNNIWYLTIFLIHFIGIGATLIKRFSKLENFVQNLRLTILVLPWLDLQERLC